MGELGRRIDDANKNTRDQVMALSEEIRNIIALNKAQTDEVQTKTKGNTRKISTIDTKIQKLEDSLKSS